jgi:carbonic anhydrase
MDRRGVLRLMGLGAICPVCSTVASAAENKPKAGGLAAAGHAGKPHWAYQGSGGPAEWGKLSPDFRMCEIGLAQTPIDLKGAVPADPGPLEVNFQKMPLKIVNNGHTIQVNCAPGSYTKIGDTRFELLQFHFHHPSEHLLNGKSFELECHFVHKSAAGDLAVLGVFLRRGQENDALAPIFDAMPNAEGPEVVTSITIDPAALLPKSRSYFRYFGSLTTPPCSEGLIWTVFKEPVEVADAQVRRFASLFPMNARPPLLLGKRFLLESR